MNLVRKKIISGIMLHARPSGVLAKAAKDFKSEIKINFNSVDFNAKNLLALMGSCIKIGDSIELICDGQDELEAMAAIEKILANEQH